MRIMKVIMFIAMSMLLSVSVSASDVGYKNNTESYVIASTDFQEIAKLTVIATDNEVPFTGTSSIESLQTLKPEKYEKPFSLIYTVLKPTNKAVIQNQNFDRMSARHVSRY